MGAFFGHLASVAQKLSFALGATVENESLHKAGKKKRNSKNKEYLNLSGNISHDCHKGKQAEDKQNFLTCSIIHISQAPPCCSFSYRVGGSHLHEAHRQ